MKALRVLAVAAALAVYLQVVLGGVVRITGSGLGCPDWPLCHGQLVPSFDYHTLVEYAHRLVGSATGLLIVATAVWAFFLYRRDRAEIAPGLVWLSVAAVMLVVVQGVIGGITVLMGNSPFTVAIHLGNALLVLGAAILVALWALLHSPEMRPGASPATTRLLYSGVLSAYLVIVSGAYVVGSGASAACGGWPACDPRGPGSLADIHFLHRLVVLGGGLVILAAAVTALRRWGGSATGAAALVTGLALLVEVGVGAAQVLGGLPELLRALHLALATLVFGGTVVVAGQLWLERRAAPRGAPARASSLAGVGP